MDKKVVELLKNWTFEVRKFLEMFEGDIDKQYGAMCAVIILLLQGQEDSCKEKFYRQRQHSRISRVSHLKYLRALIIDGRLGDLRDSIEIYIEKYGSSETRQKSSKIKRVRYKIIKTPIGRVLQINNSQDMLGAFIEIVKAINKITDYINETKK